MRVAISLVFVLVSGAFAAQPVAKKAPAPSVKKGLEAPGYLSPLARQLLKQRMKRHGRDMLVLVQSVLFLDHPTTRRLAEEIANEPRLTRPIAGGEDDLNAALPDRFFVLQDELRSRAKVLADASRASDDVALAARLGELTQTCVTCHATYLETPTP